ncbi:MAG: hypothetical protein AAB654_14190 [Acidobacteriota bacterium]
MVAIAVSGVIALGMYDYSAMMVGHLQGIAVNAVLFAIGAGLMGLASRRSSNIARWLLIPFALLIFFYDLAHFADMLDRGWMGYFAVARVGLMATAIYFLFTPRPRAWFAGHPMPPGGEDEDWS